MVEGRFKSLVVALLLSVLSFAAAGQVGPIKSQLVAEAEQHQGHRTRQRSLKKNKDKSSTGESSSDNVESTMSPTSAPDETSSSGDDDESTGKGKDNSADVSPTSPPKGKGKGKMMVETPTAAPDMGPEKKSKKSKGAKEKLHHNSKGKGMAPVASPTVQPSTRAFSNIPTVSVEKSSKKDGGKGDKKSKANVGKMSKEKLKKSKGNTSSSKRTTMTTTMTPVSAPTPYPSSVTGKGKKKSKAGGGKGKGKREHLDQDTPTGAPTEFPTSILVPGTALPSAFPSLSLIATTEMPSTPETGGAPSAAMTGTPTEAVMMGTPTEAASDPPVVQPPDMTEAPTMVPVSETASPTSMPLVDTDSPTVVVEPVEDVLNVTLFEFYIEYDMGNEGVTMPSDAEYEALRISTEDFYFEVLERAYVNTDTVIESITIGYADNVEPTNPRFGEFESSDPIFAAEMFVMDLYAQYFINVELAPGSTVPPILELQLVFDNAQFDPSFNLETYILEFVRPISPVFAGTQAVFQVSLDEEVI